MTYIYILNDNEIHFYLNLIIHYFSFQLVYCFLYSTYGTQPGIFVIGFTVGLAWEIPTDLREYFYEHGKEQLHVRDRRQLYKKIEIFLDA